MINKIIIFILSLLKDVRYWIILLVFIILFLFNKSGLNNQSQSNPSKFINLHNAIILDSDQPSNRSNINMSTLPSNGYRLMFSYIVSDKSGSESLTEPNTLNDKIEVTLISSGGKRKQIKSTSIEHFDQWEVDETLFIADDVYNSIEFSKSLSDNNKIVAISNIEVDALSDSNFNNLKPSIFGQNIIDKGSVFGSLDSKEQIASLKSKSSYVIQTFIAEHELLTAVDISMNFVGTGGKGAYTLELVSLKNDKEPDSIISSTEFDKTAEQYYQVQPNVYRLPISGNLTVGTRYGLRVINNNVDTSIFNYLQLFGVKQVNAGKDKAYFVTNRSSEIGALSLEIFYSKLTNFNNDALLIGARVRDLGNGRGIYTYNQTGTEDDLLNIKSPDVGVTFDRLSNGIISEVKPNAGFVIKLNTAYPSDRIYINAKQYDGSNYQFTQLEYSLDGKTWQAIDLSDKEYKAKILDTSISLKEMSSIIYIKFIPDKKSDAGQTFGVSSLFISANLKIN